MNGRLPGIEDYTYVQAFSQDFESEGPDFVGLQPT